MGIKAPYPPSAYPPKGPYEYTLALSTFGALWFGRAEMSLVRCLSKRKLFLERWKVPSSSSDASTLAGLRPRVGGEIHC